MSPRQTDRTRILILIKGLGIGGAETLIAEASTLWNREDFDYGVSYMLPWKDQLVSNLTEAGIEVHPLNWTRLSDLKAMTEWRRLVGSWQPDIVHSHLPAAGVFARTLTPTRNHVYTEHNVVTSYRVSTRVLNRATYGLNRAVIAVSDAVAESLVGYPGPVPRVIRNGVSVTVSDEEIVRARAELGLRLDDRLVIHVGNIRPHKGHATLIDAAKLLLEEFPDVTIASIGGEKYPGDLARLNTLAQANGIDDRLRFLGRREDARSFLAAGDVVVNPADVEGLPVAILEALALARPVVATAVGGVPSVIHHEETGLLVPPRDQERLAAALATALTSPAAADWGKEGARLIQREFGLESMVRSYEDVYRQIHDG